MRALWAVFRDTGLEWYTDRGSRMGAALAFYTVFSLAPLLVIVISIAALVFEQETAQRHIMEQIRELVGTEAAKGIQMVLERGYRPTTGIVATVIGIITLLFGATIVFGELQDALNTIWKVPGNSGRSWVIGVLRDRLISFIVVVGIGFLLLTSLVASTVLATLGEVLRGVLPGRIDILRIGNIVFLFSMVMLLAAMVYKVLPDINIAWSDVFIGAFITAVLFMIGKVIIGFYLNVRGVAWAYGAAGSLVIVLIWVYYSAQIFYFGAEFTKVYAHRYGSRRPEKGSE